MAKEHAECSMMYHCLNLNLLPFDFISLGIMRITVLELKKLPNSAIFVVNNKKVNLRVG